MNSDKTVFHRVHISGTIVKVDFISNGIMRREFLDKRTYSNFDSNGNIIFNLEKIQQKIKGFTI